MGVFDRLKRILSSAGSERGEEESPELTLARLLADMRRLLKTERLEFSVAMRDLKRVERDFRQAEAEGATHQGKARQALAAGREDLAREHLRRKVACLDLARTLKREWELHGKTVKAMGENLGKIEERIREAQARRNTLLSRKRRIEAMERFRKRLPPEMADEAISRALSQLRDRVDVMEITQDPDSLRSSGDDELDRRFKELEAEVAREAGALGGVEDLKSLLLEGAGGEEADEEPETGPGEGDSVENGAKAPSK